MPRTRMIPHPPPLYIANSALPPSQTNLNKDKEDSQTSDVIPSSVEEHQVTVAQIPSSNRNKELPSSTSDLSQPQVEDDFPIPNAQCHHKAQPSIEEVEATPNLTQLFLQTPKPDNPCASTQRLDVSCPIPPSSSLFSDTASSDESIQSISDLTSQNSKTNNRKTSDRKKNELSATESLPVPRARPLRIKLTINTTRQYDKQRKNPIQNNFLLCYVQYRN